MVKKSKVGPGSQSSAHKKRRVFFRIGIGLIILLAIGYLAIGGIAASQLTLPKYEFNPDLNPSVYDLDYEELRLSARNDGKQIAAWYIPSENNEKAIILVHGRDNSRTNGFCDGFVSFASDLHKNGFSVMMIDLRGHGQSEESRFYFGIKEYQDVLGAVDWLMEHGYQPGKIGVLGYSLGAASVIYAAAEEEDIGAIWIDSAFADIKSVIERNWKSESGLPQVFLYSAEGMIRLLYGYNITSSRPVDPIEKIAPRPIFIAHCKDDNLIPIAHMDKLLTVAENTQSWVIENCDLNTKDLNLPAGTINNHAIGYSLQPEVYTLKVVRFFSDNLE